MTVGFRSVADKDPENPRAWVLLVKAVPILEVKDFIADTRALLRFSHCPVTCIGQPAVTFSGTVV